jgi:uncharacterized membrane protein
MPTWSTRDLILAVSVAVNLVLLGFLVGAGVRMSGPGAAQSATDQLGPSFAPRGVVEGLPPEARRTVRRAIIGEGARSAPLLRELREARAAFEATASAEPFDIEATRAALENVREVERRLQDRSGELMIGILEGLPSEERAQALRDMLDRGRRFRGRRGGRDRDDAPPSTEPDAPPQ